jgi:hypothetical protein
MMTDDSEKRVSSIRGVVKELSFKTPVTTSHLPEA